VARLVIYGTGVVGRMAAHYFSQDSPHVVSAFAVDAAHLRATEWLGRPVVPAEELPHRYPPESYRLFVALGYARMNAVRAEKYAAFRRLGYRLVSYVSSKALWLAEEPPGDNAFVLEGVIVQPSVRVGSNVTLWSGACLSHDTQVEDHVFLGPRVTVAGGVRIGTRSFLGVGAVVRDRVTLGPRTLVGAGAVITTDTPPDSVFAAPRAVRLERTSEEVTL